ncbi:hypothetical protein FE840_020390 (plasmid) [Peteryoungia desertarenae]|uniref:Uncharacterized protein n=1 Tax=Peteryoungia desertarenae TaxID=1813451 RepID=A0ABX6QTM4_9HYPH|nr:hypothetical protein [Peteryoungia desertarenae]QLF71959.1 hypothetical protein FE840_020390 [Peteryoungia desertarenae]
MTYRLTTLGSCRLETEAGEIVNVSHLAIVMLAFLVDRDAPMTRRDIAELLWPGNREAAATNLRSLLRRLGAISPDLVASLTQGGMTHLVADKQTVASDLFLSPLHTPLERLRLATDAVLKRFLPTEGEGSRPVDLWVRDVRTRHVARLRSEFLGFDPSSLLDEARAELQRAAVILLERDPHDEAVRAFLTPSRQPALVMAGHSPLLDIAAPGQWEFARGAAEATLAWTPPRVALLPPETTDAAGQAGSVANALIEDLTIDLCASRAVSVVAPYTSQQIRASKDKAEMLQRHRVVYALDSQRSGDKLFVQLVFMPTDEVIWATRFHLDPRSVSDQRREMADAIKGSIMHMMASQASYSQDFASHPDAYFTYLRGVQSLSELTLPAVRRARRHFREALEHRRDFGVAMAGISRTLSFEWLLTARGDKDLLLEAERLSRKAMEQNPELAGAYKELGVSQLYLGKIDDSVEALARAEELSPNYADVLYSHADSLVHASDPQAALVKIMLAMDLNPEMPDVYLWTAAGASFFLYQFPQALEYIGRMNDSAAADRLAAACWAMIGETTNAKRCRDRVLKVNPSFDLETWIKAVPHKEKWQDELYRDALVKAGFS